MSNPNREKDDLPAESFKMSLQVDLYSGAVVLHILADSLKPGEAQDENDGEHDVVQTEEEDGPLPLSLKWATIEVWRHLVIFLRMEQGSATW